MKRYQIPFRNLPVQEQPPNTIKLLEKKTSLLVDQEILELFEKGAIQKSEPAQEEFLNHFVLVQKKDWGKPSGGKSEKNLYIAYEHSKMEDLHCLKFLLKQNNFLCNVDLKDVYFVIPI